MPGFFVAVRKDVFVRKRFVVMPDDEIEVRDSFMAIDKIRFIIAFNAD
jgi:hypothetical protein